MGITLAISVMLNIVLITWFRDNYNNGAIGAAITVVITNMLLFTLNMLYVSKITTYRPRVILKTITKSVIAVIVMAISAFYLKSIINVFIVIVISGIIYFITLFLLKGFKKEDIISIYNSFRKKST